MAISSTIPHESFQWAKKTAQTAGLDGAQEMNHAIDMSQARTCLVYGKLSKVTGSNGKPHVLTLPLFLPASGQAGTGPRRRALAHKRVRLIF